MANPIASQIGSNFVNVYVWGAAPYIRKALLLDAEVTIMHESRNGETRMLLHSAIFRATVKLPWPLSKVQPHQVDFTVSDRNNTILARQVYSRSKIDEAIEVFLHGLYENDTISINVE